MAQSRARRWAKRLLIVLFSLVAVAIVVNAFYLADLRPEGLAEDTPEARAAAAERLDALAVAHGLDAWEGYQVMDVDVEDVWHGQLMQRGMMHWKESPQSLHGRYVRGGWTGELELLSGPDAGDRWGVQSWKSWKADPGGDPVFEDDAVVEFVVPTTQYFLELPLRIRSATLALEASKQMLDGKNYDVVFATWESPEPLSDMDQYVLFIDPDTGLLARTDFTVRDQGGSMVGSARYLNYDDFGGVKMARRIEIFGLMPGGFEIPVHTFVTNEVAWDESELDELRPDPTLPDEGESKPDS